MFAVSYGRCLEEKDSVCESQHVVPAGPDSVVVEPCQVNFSPPGPGTALPWLDIRQLASPRRDSVERETGRLFRLMGLF
jgi:hypothetical protein